MPRPRKYPQELIERGGRLALEGERPIAHVAADLGMGPETLPELLSSSEREEIRRLRKENYELRRANEILKRLWLPTYVEGAGARRRARGP